MNSRSFIVLVTVVLAMAALLYWQSSNDTPEEVEPAILPGLAAVLNEVERVTVIGAGNETLATLERGDRYWTVAERGGYRADVGRIRKNLTALAEARIVEYKTADPALHTRLGVEELADPAAAGKEFFIATPSGSFRLIVGNSGTRGGMAYVRRPDDAQSFLVSAEFDPGDDTADWLRRDLLDIDAERIHRVTITHPDGEVLRIEKPTQDAAAFTVADMPEGRELQYATILNSLTGLLTDLTLDDVAVEPDPGAPLPIDDDSDESTPVGARFETFDGLVVDATVREGGRRVVFGVRADEALAVRFLPPGDAEDDSVEQASFAAVSEEAQRLSETVHGWVYTLPSFKTDQLVRRLDEILKPVD